MLTFFAEFLKHPFSVGAVAPSSHFLARTILAAADLKNCHAIVEFGPGTGAFTKYVCKQLRPDQRYIGIELNTNFTLLLRRKFPTLAFVNDSVENLQAISSELNLDRSTPSSVACRGRRYRYAFRTKLLRRWAN
jgi:phosphatidylethanolamine/phosphatidyl-N-methylethanolamine N-methyltransferase